MLDFEVQPHIRLQGGQVEPVVLTVGDPARVEAVLQLCDSSKELANNREYRSAAAVSNGQKFTVISHGVGGCGAMICFEELISLGAKVIIRAGTCGTLKPEKLRTGDIFVPFAVARDPDVTDMYADPRMPAVATPRVYNQLLEAGKTHGVPLSTGVGLSSGLFYGRNRSFRQHLSKWAELVDAAECEFQALFLVGSARDVETGGIATVDGSPLQWEEANYEPGGSKCREGVEKMLKVAIATCEVLAKGFQTTDGDKS